MGRAGLVVAWWVAVAAAACGGGSSPGNGESSGTPGGQTGETGGADQGSGDDDGADASVGSTGGGGTQPGTDDGGSGATGDGGSGSDGGTIPVGTIVTPGDAGSADLHLEVHADQDQRPISPLIYGSNENSDIADSKLGLLRLGGNRLTAYNWESNASNAGADYDYQNDGLLEASNTPGQTVTDSVNSAKSVGATSLITIPIVDYVAADKNGGGDIRNSANYMTTRLKQNRALKGAALASPPDATDAYVNQDEMVSWMKTTYPQQPTLFEMDNEPDLWSTTHPEVHPSAPTYAEVCTRNASYATMVKSLYPGALVAGPASYGWQGYVNLNNASDASGKGEFIDYYLGQMKAAEATAGHRVVDYLDLHWYPEATGGGERITGTQTDAAIVAARVQAPRSLWDPTYKETSWIEQSINAPIELIPLMLGKIAKDYPGTKLAITEWNYGGGQDISGAVASADVLGVFGREGVGMAAQWPLTTETFTHAAFRAFRNYDGTGSAFGDTSILATTSDVQTATVYGSLDASRPSREVVVVINKATATKSATLALFAGATYTKLAVYTVTAAGGAGVKPAAAVNAAATNAFLVSLPAMSISVFVPQ
jgi:hypothetical protein